MQIRKAVTIAEISEERDCIQQFYKQGLRTETMIPPIYSRLIDGNGDIDEWQVTNYNKDFYQFETYKCKLPKWVDECPKLKSHLLSNNRLQLVQLRFTEYFLLQPTLGPNLKKKDTYMPCIQFI